MTASYAYSMQQGPTNSLNGGNNANFGNSIQNFNHGRDLVQNNAGGRIAINNHGRDDSDDEDDNEDRPLDSVMFRKELKAFKRQYPLDDDELRKLDGQNYLNRWQRLIITALSGELTLGSSKADILDAMVQLSNVSGLAPKCLRIHDVGIKICSPIQDAQAIDVAVFKGKVGTLDVTVKKLKETGPDGEQLKTLLKHAVAWQKLNHRNVLPFLGLYYFDESRERLCVVYPWMEQHNFGEINADQVTSETLNELARGTVDGLQYIHDQKVIHGDLQTSTFLTGPSDVARIADLGLAQLLGKAADKSEDSDKYNCAYALCKLYRGNVPLESPPSRPPRVSDEIWGVLQEWLIRAINYERIEKDPPPPTQTPVPDPERRGSQDHAHSPIVAQNHDVLSHTNHVNNGDNAHFSAVGGSQFNSHANRTQSINCGRDHNLNNGSGPLTVNNKEQWTPTPVASPLPPISLEYGNNTGEGTRNVNMGRDQNADHGGGAFAINNDNKSGRSSSPTIQAPMDLDGMERREPTHSPSPNVGIPNARPPSGEPLSSEDLARKEDAFRNLLTDEKEYESVLELDGDDGQNVLDNWQQVKVQRDFFFITTIHKEFSTAERADPGCLFPQCLQIGGVEDVSDYPVEYGGFADIWTGSVGGMRVALKVVRYRFHSQRKHNPIKAFVREAMIWRNMIHPNVLPFTGMYWFNPAQGQICLISPWMESGNLLQFLTDTPEVDHAAQQRLAKDVAQGLAYLHDLKITHGDLKGYNVLVGDDRIARITDFGLSQVIGDQRLTSLSSMAGRQGPTRWLAPEIMENGRNMISQETDVYAYGCVNIFLYNGQLSRDTKIYAKCIPFEEHEEYGLYHIVVIRGQRPELPQDVPNGMRQMIEKCWQVEPGSRPKAATLVQEIGRM
ncbi:Rho guanine nucleotide exchange factor [Marasmius sp. AFHP31]|nr:Rho guanine nucleotide exchange factor [Marasmius sp. AFHP31]